MVYLGDNLLLDYDLRGRAQEFSSSDADAGVLLTQVDDPQRYGVAEFNSQGGLIALEEKPKNPRSNYVVVGVYFLRPSVFDVIHHLRPSWRGELEVTDALHALLSSPRHRVTHYVVDGWWDDTGTPDDILKANMYVLDRKLSPANCGQVEDGARIEGRAFIGKDAVISRGSLIRGPACIGDKCKIGPDTYVGPYTSIGEGCHLSNTHVENSVILPGVRLECPTVIIDSLIGKDSLIAVRGTRLPMGHRLILGENSLVLLGNHLDRS
jgi:glucose-1-phosphate thymidylyltransferase